MRTYRFFFIAVMVVFLVAAGVFWTGHKRKSIVFLSGAGMKAPVNEIVEYFERKTGIEVLTRFDGSSILRDYILNSNSGDVFLPGDKKNIDILTKKGLVAESSFIAWHIVAILVSPEARERITSLDDLAKEGVRLALSNPELASLGRIVVKNIIEKHPRGRDILQNVVVYGASSQDVMALYKKGNIDAIIEWDVMARTPDGKGLTVVSLNKPYQVKDELFVGLLKTAREPKLAKRFYDYMVSDGKEIFRKHGYDID